MTSVFLPGFDDPLGVEADIPADAPPAAPDPRPAKEVSPLAHRPTPDAYHSRVRWFLRSLSPARRAQIAQRRRFYRIPWVRLASEADQLDEDDRLP